jgi:hypothetical protein
MGLAVETLTTHAHAARAYRERSLPYLAWATRSLFELGLWTDYSTRSSANAQRFTQDTVRDFVGLLTALGIPNRDRSDSGAALEELQDLLMKVASTLGMEDLNADYTRAYQAARDMGHDWGECYTQVNRVLSKFVHPTALLMNSPVCDEFVHHFSDLFMQLSDVCASEIFEMIKSAPEEHELG